MLNKLFKGKLKSSKPKTRLGKILRILRNLLIIFLIITILPVFIYKWVNPPITPLMIIRKFEGNSINKKWVPIEEMSSNLPIAAIAAEDDEFMTHHGFDMDAMQKAYEKNQKQPNQIRGGSTISQQTAKNVFLWPHRDYLRKGLEAWFTVLIEFIWGKERIMEVYLNVVEMGDGIYGMEAASQEYYKKPASKLSKPQAAALISVLPNPHIFKVLKPSAHTQAYRNAILYRMYKMDKIKF
jgi:monofunctional glycosyltransferase